MSKYLWEWHLLQIKKLIWRSSLKGRGVKEVPWRGLHICELDWGNVPSDKRDDTQVTKMCGKYSRHRTAPVPETGSCLIQISPFQRGWATFPLHRRQLSLIRQSPSWISWAQKRWEKAPHCCAFVFRGPNTHKGCLESKDQISSNAKLFSLYFQHA